MNIYNISFASLIECIGHACGYFIIFKKQNELRERKEYLRILNPLNNF